MLQRLACTSCMAREGPLPLQWACPSSKGARLSLPSQGGAVRARGCEVVATVAAEGALHGALVQGGRGGARMGGGGESCCMLLLPAASSARDCSRCTDGGGSKAAPCMLQGAGMLKAWPPCRMGRAPLFWRVAAWILERQGAGALGGGMAAVLPTWGTTAWGERGRGRHGGRRRWRRWRRRRRRRNVSTSRVCQVCAGRVVLAAPKACLGLGLVRGEQEACARGLEGSSAIMRLIQCLQAARGAGRSSIPPRCASTHATCMAVKVAWC
mmetsp:Transcript_9931/g.26978  ORF Transcript_9931/g.26978 Transcript_9931/m.26978 type:complete len:268 (-) Transcript_9931:3057-3860(-)